MFRFISKSLLLGSAFLLAGALGPAKKPSAEIRPGPASISPEERAITEDPAAGVEHAVILVEETDRDEDLGAEMEIRYHRRAKILSNEGRDLANIEIPFSPRRDRLKEWWGRTMLPDGTVLELDQSKLERQTVARAGGAEWAAFKAALPGVVPGCVIDYGYVIRAAGYVPFDSIPVQRSWPVREFFFHWKPLSRLVAAYFMPQSEGLDVHAEMLKKSVVVRGRNLPPVVDEPLMPPDHMVRARLVLYYVPPGTNFERYWKDMCKNMEFRLRHTVKPRSVDEAIQTMNLSAGAPMERVRAAYDWLGQNVKRTSLQTFEEIEETTGDKEAKGRDPVARLLDSRTGSAYRINQAFIAIARELGVEAHFLAAPNRTRNYWIPELKTFAQFETMLVAVRPPGTPVDQAVVVDPCSGLPFGEVPWWYSGVSSMLMTKQGPHPLLIPGSPPDSNVSDTRVEMAFEDENQVLVERWTRSGSGQVGLDERRYLRSLAPRERAERLDRLCGAGPDTDVLESELVGLDELDRELELRCELETYGTEIEERVGHYHMAWTGPWVEPLPDLPPGPRHHAVVFDFPRAEILTLKVRAPAGFVPHDPPQDVDVKDEMGRYRLRVVRTDDGYEVKRDLAVLPLMVPAESYDHLREFLERVRGHDRTRLKFRRAEMAR